MTMTMGKAAVLAATMAAAIAGAPARAADRGAYVALNGGVASVDDVNVTYYDSGDTLGTRAKFKDAFAVRGTLGYDFGLIRADVELGYSRNRVKAVDVRAVNGAPVTLTPAQGVAVCGFLDADDCSASGNRIRFRGSRLRQLSGLANLWVDIPLHGRIAPYLGGGLGATGFEFEGEGKARFAWQLGAGVAIKLTPATAITADFRHRQAKGATIPDDDASGVTIGKVRTNSFTGGFRFTF